MELHRQMRPDAEGLMRTGVAVDDERRHAGALQPGLQVRRPILGQVLKNQYRFHRRAAPSHSARSIGFIFACARVQTRLIVSVPAKESHRMKNKSLAAYWMPFTANRQFKQAPRMLERAEGMYFWTPEGRQVLDGIAGLWCVNAGHARPKIVEAIRAQASEMDFAPPFQMGHPKAFELAERLVKIAPTGLSKVF